MSAAPLPVAISCGEPAGIGPEIVARAWATLAAQVPMVWIGDPTHLPVGTPHQVIRTCAEAAAISHECLPVLAHDFGGDDQAVLNP